MIIITNWIVHMYHCIAYIMLTSHALGVAHATFRLQRNQPMWFECHATVIPLRLIGIPFELCLFIYVYCEQAYRVRVACFAVWLRGMPEPEVNVKLLVEKKCSNLFSQCIFWLSISCWAVAMDKALVFLRCFRLSWHAIFSVFNESNWFRQVNTKINNCLTSLLV